MKKLIMFCLAFALCLPIFGCNRDVEKVLKNADTLYLTIKVIVEDPAVYDVLSDGTLDKLRLLEDRYLTAKQVYLAGQRDGTTVDKIFDIAGGLVTVFDDLPQIEKHGDEISAARVAVKALRVLLQ